MRILVARHLLNEQKSADTPREWRMKGGNKKKSVKNCKNKILPDSVYERFFTVRYKISK